MTIELEHDLDHSAPSSRPGPQPLATAGASYLGAALSVAVIAIGAVAIRETAVAAGWITGERWVAGAVGALDGAAPTSWLPFAAIAVAILGLVLMLVAVKPRRRRAVQVDARSAVYIDLTDVARIASAAAETVPGVVSARTTASRRSITVRCETTAGKDTGLDDAVARAVATELAALERTSRIRVRLTKRSGS